MSGRTRFPFTATQWQELEHQALIYKYMVSGIPIPPHLLFSIKTSSFFPPHIGWSCFQVGQDKKIDPEPGRCRRTDGKKWRCSKEAYPDSKYCERHMHRGKNRSRKPVEVSASPTQTIHSPSNLSSSSLTTTTTTKILPINKTSSYNSLSLLSSETYHHHQGYLHYPDYHALGHPQFLASHTSSSRPPGNIGISSEDKNSTQFLFDSAGSCSSLTNADYRNREVYGMKEVVGEHAFFSETSGSVRSLSGTSLDDAWQLTPLTMSCSTAKQQRLFQHGYLLENDDMKCLNPIKFEKEEEPQKTVHRFFDECPPKNNNKKDSWLDLDDKSSNTAFSTTSLSISIPSSSYDFPIFNSRAHNDG